MTTKKKKPSQNTTLITGASSGIGAELAHCFAQDGYNLVLIARREKELKEIAAKIQKQYSVEVRVIAKDLSRPDAPHELYQELNQVGVTIDILVNNAAFGNYGFFISNNIKRELEMLSLNVSALTHLTSLFAKGMVERKQGKILNVASTAAFQPGPLMATYFASKAYVLSFSEALTNELQGTGVSVTCLCPGPTETEFSKVAGTYGLKLPKRQRMSAKDVAMIGYRGLMKRKTVVIAGLSNKILVIGSKFLPRSIATAFVRRIHETGGKHKL
ncbi:MAG: SDR family oxidoreductase [Candidatus Omnitrophica bacterium]|nr:SDR family oxidoreductase [Candidatus Omnitrophota bacterium]